MEFIACGVCYAGSDLYTYIYRVNKLYRYRRHVRIYFYNLLCIDAGSWIAVGNSVQDVYWLALLINCVESGPI